LLILWSSEQTSADQYHSIDEAGEQIGSSEAVDPHLSAVSSLATPASALVKLASKESQDPTVFS
jgi:hypothetical protein